MHDLPEHLHKTLRPWLSFDIAGPHDQPKGKDFPPHQHSTWELVYYRSGHIQCLIGADLYECRPGVFLLTPPGVVHTEYAWTAYSNFWIQIHAPADYPWPRICLDDAEHNFERVCAALARESSRQAPGREEMLQLLLNQLAILIERTQERQLLSEAERLVRAAEQLIEERFAARITIQEIAREVGIAPSSLRAQFMSLRGKSPMAHLQTRRVQHALALLRNSSLTLEAVASLSGYDSASHLSRYVKRATGKSPGALRSGLAGGLVAPPHSNSFKIKTPARLA
jgi:AraC-like DNA-binding protein